MRSATGRVIGNLEDRRVSSLLIGDDHLGNPHAVQMLDRSGVPSAMYVPAPPPPPPAVWPTCQSFGAVAGIDPRRASADCRAERVGERLDIFGKVFAALQSRVAGDDDLCRVQFRRSSLGDFLADKLRGRGSPADAAFSPRAAASPAAAKSRSAPCWTSCVPLTHGLDRVAAEIGQLEGSGRDTLIFRTCMT